ncbi:MAG: hypothetical protein R6V60_04085, partial [Desulfobacterales bacterium]
MAVVHGCAGLADASYGGVGIKIHNWDDWVDPFRLTQDAYWKFQAEKERKLYAVI